MSYVGSLNFMNFNNHVKLINKMLAQYQPRQTLILSFRFVHLIEGEAVSNFSSYVKNLR